MDRPASPGSRADDRNPRRSWPTGRRSSIREWWIRASRSWTYEEGGPQEECATARARPRTVGRQGRYGQRRVDRAETGVLSDPGETRDGSACSPALKGMISGPVERYELPNLHALNFLLHGALDGGGTISLKTDAQGKVFSTALLRLELELPK